MWLPGSGVARKTVHVWLSRYEPRLPRTLNVASYRSESARNGGLNALPTSEPW